MCVLLCHTIEYKRYNKKCEISMLQFNVQALLDKKDKTRYWLVKQMGTDYATVNKICDNASKSVRIDTLERLMKALDCEVQDLFTEE